jgi:MerR family transcriptional regulator, thiopeptide resistance regulator
VTGARTYHVKDLARLAGVSVRTLHHYHAIGLLVPKARTAAGYRLYTDSDLLRLQQVLIGRELGLALEEIRRALDDPRFDRKAALLEQRERLKGRAQQTEAMIRAIDVALAALEGDGEKGIARVEDLFEGFNPSLYDEEVRQRWGQSHAFIDATAQTGHYTPDDWKAYQAEQIATYEEAASAMRAGRTPSDAAVMDIAERHRLSIDRWVYRCSHEMHRGLAFMYEGDDRFRQYIDTHGEGLTEFLAEAIRANAARHD